MVTTTDPTRFLQAYLHTAGSGHLHLRVRLSSGMNFDDALCEDFRRVGSPATYSPKGAPFTWDYPLTAAAVVTLQRVAEQWQLPIQWAPELTQFAEEQAKIEAYEKQVRLAIEKAMQHNESLPDYPTRTVMPNGVDQCPPMRHQRISYHWGLRSTALMLAHEPGLGKTREGCDLIAGWYREGIIRPMEQVWLPPVYDQKTGVMIRGNRWGVRGGVLVVCPKGMMRTWKDELALWQNAMGVEIAGAGRKAKNLKAGTIGHVHICNYESLDVVLGNEYDAIVPDECHRLANNSGFTQNTMELSQKAKRKLFLSGTPVSNSLESVFYQMLILDGGRSLGASKTAFLEQWFETETVGPGISISRPKKDAVTEVSKLMSRCTYFLKKDECTDLPPRLHTPMTVEMDPEQQRYYDELKKETLVYIQDSTVTVEQAAARMMKLRQVTQGFVLDDHKIAKTFNSGKLDAMEEMLRGKLAGRKVVVWAVFTHEIDLICRRLQQMNLGYVRFDGTVTSKKVRDHNLELWNKDNRITVFVGQIQMGVGITLHAQAQKDLLELKPGEMIVPCYDCIYVGIDYSYTNWVQSVDRIHRIGQKYSCNYTYLLTSNGIDRSIYAALQVKKNTAEAVHKTGKEFFRSLLVGDTPSLSAVA